MEKRKEINWCKKIKDFGIASERSLENFDISSIQKEDSMDFTKVDEIMGGNEVALRYTKVK